jgi:hypothetical protein
LFPRYTGQMFDAITPAIVAASHTIAQLTNEQRAARLVEQHALDPSMPGLGWVLDELIAATFRAKPANPYEAEIARAVQRVVVEHLTTLAGNSDMSQVRAIASMKLQQRMQAFAAAPEGAHERLLAADIKRFLERPAPPATRSEMPSVPPGAPIGEPAMDWLSRVEPWCSGS